jgi:RNA polymerase sigma-70 factor (ECF subfamily)
VGRFYSGRRGGGLPAPRRAGFNARRRICVQTLVRTRDQSRPPEDSELVERARGGDSEALELLVSTHQGVVYRFLLGFLKDEDEAADATQDTFLKALDRLDGFRGDSSFRTWLLVIARNQALGLIRTRGRRREEPLEDTAFLADDSARPDEEAIREEEIRRVREALEQLPEKQRLSVSLRLFDQLSFKEIGEVIDSSEGAARVNYHYGIGRLREFLDERVE